MTVVRAVLYVKRASRSYISEGPGRCDFSAAGANHLPTSATSTHRSESVTTATLAGVDADARFAELIERHRGIVVKVAAMYCRNRADREDVAQEIVTQLWRAYPKYDATRTFSTWMYRIALNVAISFVRTNSVHVRHAVALDDRHDVEDSSTSEDDERVRSLYAFIEQLDALNRALLLLYLDEHSYRDIAVILGITETNVATKISRLKQRFAREVAR
jgi:RNA polymerase sigma factor (sigma-70 family)